MTATVSTPAKSGQEDRVEAAKVRMRRLLAEFLREPARDWDQRAECREADGRLFAPVDRTATGWKAQLEAEATDIENHQRARTYCARCPVVADCLAEALANNREGTWGGQRLASIDWVAGREVKKEMNL